MLKAHRVAKEHRVPPESRALREKTEKMAHKVLKERPVQMDKTAGGSGYLRTGRRNLDGTMFLKAMLYPEKELLTDIIDVYKVWDKDRPLPVDNVAIPEGVTGVTFPDGTFLPFDTN